MTAKKLQKHVGWGVRCGCDECEEKPNWLARETRPRAGSVAFPILGVWGFGVRSVDGEQTSDDIVFFEHKCFAEKLSEAIRFITTANPSEPEYFADYEYMRRPRCFVAPLTIWLPSGHAPNALRGEGA